MYRRVKTEGRSIRKPPLIMRHLSAENILESRLGFVVRKRTGHAPMRNSIRRTLRESFRSALADFSRPAWVVFDVMDNAAQFPRRTLRENAGVLLATLTGKAP